MWGYQEERLARMEREMRRFRSLIDLLTGVWSPRETHSPLGISEHIEGESGPKFPKLTNKEDYRSLFYYV